MVNLTSAPVRPLRSVLPVYDLRVMLNLDRKSLNHHKVLRAQSDFTVKGNGNEMEIHLDKLQDFFSIHLVVEN
jgi:hypothetical protein